MAAVQWLRLGVESVGAIIVASGVVVSVVRVVRVLGTAPPRKFNDVRISFARFLALALEFQLGADILSTAIAPSWDAIGKLGALHASRSLGAALGWRQRRCARGTDGKNGLEETAFGRSEALRRPDSTRWVETTRATKDVRALSR